MVGLTLLSYAIDTASEVWNMEPHRNVRISSFKTDDFPEIVDGLWTDKGLRPTANNLAFTVKYVQDSAEKRKWAERLQQLPIRGWLLVADDLYYLQSYNQFNRLEEQKIEPDELRSVLTAPKSKLFTPKALAEFRKGQLSLADLEESISEGSFSFILRQREELDRAFQSGIETALGQISLPKRSPLRPEMEGHVIRVAIAFLAARILEDKGFFSDSPIPTNNPRELLKRTVSRLNGFFKRAQQESIPSLEEFLPNDTDRVLQALAANFGNCVTFALVDHRDVGILYERAIKELPKKLAGQDWTDLQRHYTPVAIAERMLELLPLERIRPEERVIFDPAAGSGSLLLAATSRLAGMSDIPEDINARNIYLANHIAGNDLDEYANLVTQLRYVLARESLGESVAFPFPDHFSHKDYETLKKDNLEIKPRVIVANPPFSEDGNTQRAARFVECALSWLDEGSQFAFVLPQSFLTNTTHGISEARKLLSENCQIFEVWQLPEKTVGIEAQQAICIVLGSVGKSQQIFPSVARAVFSRAENSDVRENGFLGATWITQLEPSDKIWKEVTAPIINICVPTVPLGNLFFVFNGVNPGNLGKIYPPVKECPPGVECKRNWILKWCEKNRFLADPSQVIKDKKWRRYGTKYLARPRLENALLFNFPKLFVGSRLNRGIANPLVVQFDNTGFCPNNNVFCILPVRQANKYTKGYQSTDKLPEGWIRLTDAEQRLWLLGILASKLGNELSISGRSTRQITASLLCNLPLPARIDRQIIETARQIVERDQNHEFIPEPDELRIQLNRLVEESYGNPQWMEISRTGTPTGLEEWKKEQTKPTLTVIGQVLEVSENNQQILLHLVGLIDDNEEAWLPMLPELPGWALDGTAFEAELSEDVETFQDLAENPWSLRHFRHRPYSYLTNEELEQKLIIESLEHI